MSELETPKVAVFVEPTPNPNGLKFIVGREIISGAGHEFASSAEAVGSPLAEKLFELQGVEGVFIGANFVSVRKTTEAEWSAIEPDAITIIEEGAAPGRKIVADAPKQEAPTTEAADGPEAIIRKILDEEVRPAIAGDGGDVTFEKYVDGVLTLRLMGSCSGCPSSLMTLRMGIERRLREDVPELKEVISLM